MQTRETRLEYLEQQYTFLQINNAALCTFVDKKEAHIVAVYEERDQLISLMLKMADLLSWKTGISTTNRFGDITHVVIVELPCGQVSWTIPSQELHLYESLLLWEGTIEIISPIVRTWRILHPFVDPLASELPHVPSIGLPPEACAVVPLHLSGEKSVTDPLVSSNANTLKMKEK